MFTLRFSVAQPYIEIPGFRRTDLLYTRSSLGDRLLLKSIESPPSPDQHQTEVTLFRLTCFDGLLRIQRILDIDGEQAFFRASDVATLTFPLWTFNPDLEPGESEESEL